MSFRQIAIGALLVSVFTAGNALALTKASIDVKDPKNKEINQKCVSCHLKENKSLVHQWETSPHAAAKDGQVGCYNCHAANPDEELAYEHEGATIKSILTPNDCKGCHEVEVKEMMASHHATAGEIMASLDNMLAQTIGGSPTNKGNMNSGCWQCHGSVVTIERDKFGKPLRSKKTGAPIMDHNTWPNSGIGRINLDGSKGSCNACHSKHTFKSSMAREPENCGKCHLGPDHPQKEVYEESKHGIAYYASRREGGTESMNIMKDGKWVLGKDYFLAPTCSSCHMGAYVKVNGSINPNTHNVGDRISWTLRPPVSAKLNRVTFVDGTVTDIPGEVPPLVGAKAKYKTYVKSDKPGKLKKIVAVKQIASVLNWKERRANMQEACKSCHGVSKIENFYQQFDDVVNLYNDKFAKPGVAIVKELKKDGIWKNSGFQHELGYIWFNIWHHEGRRARHGAAMQAPDYTHWHGLYEVAWHFYHKFLPKVQKMADKAGQGEKYKKIIQELLDRPEHLWIKTGGSKETMKLIEEENRMRYKQ